MVDIDTMTEQEQKDLLAALSYRLQSKGRGEGLTADQQLVWDTLLEALGRRPYPVSRFLPEYGRARFIERAAWLHGFVNEHCKLPRRPVRVQVLHILWGCLAAHLRARDIPPGPKSMLNSLDQLEHAVDARFPGYIRAGLLVRVARIAA